MARTRAAKSAKEPPQTPTVQTASPPRRSTRKTRTTQPIHDIASDEDDSTVNPKKPKTTKATKKTPSHLQEATADHSPPGPRYNTRSKHVQSCEPTKDVLSGDEDDVEELPIWPRYKDDLWNAFNGYVDPSQDFISKAPVEIIDNILSFLVLDHDPDRGVKMKETIYDRRPHALISMSAMSRLFYNATEGFARRFLTQNKDALEAPYMGTYYRTHPEEYKAVLERREDFQKAREEKISKLRRSSRLAEQPQPEVLTIYRKELWRKLQTRCAVCFDHVDRRGKFANSVSVCSGCDDTMNGSLAVNQLHFTSLAYQPLTNISQTLTEALKQYDLRDYMLIKSRTPGPRAKFTDLPAIPHGSEYKSIGFPVFNTITVFYFRHKDLRALADLVHGNWVAHSSQKLRERFARQEKLRTKRVRKFVIEYHERELEVSKGKTAKRHKKRTPFVQSAKEIPPAD
jgi:hypothetical protein